MNRRWHVYYKVADPENPTGVETVVAHCAWSACMAAARRLKIDARDVVAAVDADHPHQPWRTEP